MIPPRPPPEPEQPPAIRVRWQVAIVAGICLFPLVFYIFDPDPEDPVRGAFWALVSWLFGLMFFMVLSVILGKITVMFIRAKNGNGWFSMLFPRDDS